MCNPVATAVVGALSSFSQYQGQRQQAKQQARYQQKAMEAERQRALQEQSSIRMRQAQEQEATNRELGDVAMKAREARARAITSAEGLSGASVDALIDDFTRQEAEYRMGVGRQQEMRDVQTGLALTDAGFRSQNRLIDINRPINKPSFLSGALSTVQGGVSGYRTGLELTK